MQGLVSKISQTAMDLPRPDGLELSVEDIKNAETPDGRSEPNLPVSIDMTWRNPAGPELRLPRCRLPSCDTISPYDVGEL